MAKRRGESLVSIFILASGIYIGKNGLESAVWKTSIPAMTTLGVGPRHAIACGPTSQGPIPTPTSYWHLPAIFSCLFGQLRYAMSTRDVAELGTSREGISDGCSHDFFALLHLL